MVTSGIEDEEAMVIEVRYQDLILFLLVQRCIGSFAWVMRGKLKSEQDYFVGHYIWWELNYCCQYPFRRTEYVLSDSISVLGISRKQR